MRLWATCFTVYSTCIFFSQHIILCRIPLQKKHTPNIYISLQIATSTSHTQSFIPHNPFCACKHSQNICTAELLYISATYAIYAVPQNTNHVYTLCISIICTLFYMALYAYVWFLHFYHIIYVSCTGGTYMLILLSFPLSLDISYTSLKLP